MGISKIELTELIKKQVKESELNNFAVIGAGGEPMWDEPLIGYSRGDDPYYDFLKKDIGEFYWSPAEAFVLGKKDAQIKSKDLCVVSIAFPQTQKTKDLNARENKWPTPRWVVTRGTWETFVEDISGKIVDEVEKKGLQAVATDYIKDLGRAVSEKYGAASPWSHRHTAFICGLGTFGLSDGLITRKGKAMRFTTILIAADIEADVRSYEKYNEWCRFARDGSCGDCIKRCPVGAITKEGHDKVKCGKFLDHVLGKTLESGLLNSKSAYGCGLCQCGVSCRDGIPV